MESTPFPGSEGTSTNPGGVAPGTGETPSPIPTDLQSLAGDVTAIKQMLAEVHGRMIATHEAVANTAQKLEIMAKNLLFPAIPNAATVVTPIPTAPKVETPVQAAVEPEKTVPGPNTVNGRPV